MAAGDWAAGSIVLNDSINYFVPSDNTDPKFTSAPVKLNRLPLARREGSIVGLNRWQENLINIHGLVYSTAGLSDLETKFDALMKQFNNGPFNLKVGWQDERYWKSYLAGPVQLHRLGPQIDYVAPLVAVEAFGYAAAAATPVTDNSALTSDGSNNYHKDIVVTPGGNAPTRPVFTIAVPAGGPYGLTQIAVQNLTASGQPVIRAPRTYSALDTLTIDTDTYKVSIQTGQSVDFAGTVNLILDPRPGTTNTIRILAIATSIPTLNVTINWTPRWFA
jgi:hypothetical protein